MRRVLPLVSALILSGCFSIDFDPPHLVKKPRILAITVDPPEIALGQDVLVETLIVDEDGSDLTTAPGVELSFTSCVSLRAIVSAAGFGSAGLTDDCNEGGDDLVRLETDGLPPGTARLPASALLRLAEGLTMGGGGTPPPDAQGLDPELARTLAFVIAQVGVPLRVRVEVFWDGELILVGFKRFAITFREMPTTNPPPPRFAVGSTWLSARDAEDPHRCVPEGGEAPVVEAGAEVTISPDENEEAWLESYPTVDLNAEIRFETESAFYSWYATGGSFSDDVTERPARDVTWTAPEEPGTYPIWLVVRDGHLGSSFCRADVVVE